MSLHMGEINEEVGIVDETSDVNVLKTLPLDFFGIQVLSEMAGGFQHGLEGGLKAPARRDSRTSLPPTLDLAHVHRSKTL